MEIKTDIEIAQSCEMKNIREIAATAGVNGGGYAQVSRRLRKEG